VPVLRRLRRGLSASSRDPTLLVSPETLWDKHGQPFTVRPYSPGDFAALEAMYAGFQPKRAAQGLPPLNPEGVRRWLRNVLGGGQHCLVEVGGHVLGHAMLIPMDEETVELANFLHQEVRDRGIGTEVNRLALGCAAAAGARRVWLSVEPSNRPAIRSYEKVGFRQLPGSLWSPELEMALELPQPCGAGG
jgi:ribosomal protein S18 acetylase RimI-like enzyme